MHDTGGSTVAQNEETSMVFGMPRAAIERGAADQVLGLPAIPGAIIEGVQARLVNGDP